MSVRQKHWATSRLARPSSSVTMAELGGATPGAAVLAGERQLEPPELGEAPEQLGRVVVGLVPRLGPLRRADVVDEAARPCPAAAPARRSARNP